MPAGSYHYVVRTYEWSRLEKNVIGLKFYAPGVGVIIDRVIPRLITVLLWWPIITHIHLSRIGPVSHWKMETSRLLLVIIVLGAAFVIITMSVIRARSRR